MSIERAAIQGAHGTAEKSRATKEGAEEERTNLEAMVRWYDGKGDAQRAAECRERINELKREGVEA